MLGAEVFSAPRGYSRKSVSDHFPLIVPATVSVELHFLGASGTVTGSKYLLRTEEKTILIDCGLFQGLKKLRLLNWNQLPVRGADVDLVLLTHGHLDHTGFLPRLVDLGFRGSICGTAPTLDIAEIILKDSARLQEEEAERANSRGYSRHHPARPLYDMRDAEQTLTHFRPVREDEWIPFGDDIRARFRYNGHIIGATFIELETDGKRFVFSGDIGRESDPLMRPPLRPERADVLLIESTYGDRLHPENNIREDLKKIVLETMEWRGTLIIPSFAVERTQTLMYLLWQLAEAGEIPDIPMIMDSPMGASVLGVFERYRDWHNLSAEECRQMCGRFRIVEDFAETEAIIADTGPKIVIAGSGMITGGRVLNYLETYISRPETTVLLAGFQAEGTRGRSLLDGAGEIKFFGQYHPVRARIALLDGLSSHADQRGLLNWMGDIAAAEQPPKRIFIVHGEPAAADALRVKIRDTYNLEAEVAEMWGVEIL